MKWYHVVDYDEAANPFVADSADLKGFEADHFRRGQQIQSWDSSAWYRATKPDNDGELDDVLGEHLYIPVYSKRLRETLEDAGVGGVQYLPVKVFRPDGSEIKGYAIANILSLVPALDVKRTKVVRYFPDDFPNPDARGKIEDLDGIVLRSSEIKGYDIIRLAEEPMTICVSEKVRDLFTRGKFTGYVFYPVIVG